MFKTIAQTALAAQQWRQVLVELGGVDGTLPGADAQLGFALDHLRKYEALYREQVAKREADLVTQPPVPEDQGEGGTC